MLITECFDCEKPPTECARCAADCTMDPQSYPQLCSEYRTGGKCADDRGSRCMFRMAFEEALNKGVTGAGGVP
jgi:hypothetical protein